MKFQEHVSLAEYTSIGLGGPARFFISCTSIEQLRRVLLFARDQGKRYQIIGGGSNIVFSDRGFDGVVIHIGIRGVEQTRQGDSSLVTAAAGEDWDQLVQDCVRQGLSGIECLSGIPGLVGATPIQNVGAYGQEVRDSIVSVRGLDCRTLEPVQFSAADCTFAYRSSRFKGPDRGRYIITEVSFALKMDASPCTRYPEVADYLQSTGSPPPEPGKRGLETIRSAVLALRRRKSMVLDPSDPNTKSVGSFFVNPVLAPTDFAAVQERWQAAGHREPIVHFQAPNGVKIPAGWLVQQAGYPRGYHRAGVGISTNHALALINRTGTTRELLDLAADIQEDVYKTFEVRLEREPVIVE
jgi:UDP-N-acetylmuramate dehydrogenase